MRRYSDSSWADDIYNRRSTAVYVIMLNNGPIFGPAENNLPSQPPHAKQNTLPNTKLHAKNRMGHINPGICFLFHTLLGKFHINSRKMPVPSM